MTVREGEQGHTRVVVVDDHHAVRSGISAVLLAVTDIEMVGEAADGEEALRVCEEVRPDVVIMDLKLPRGDGIAAIRQLHQRAPEIKVLALTSFPDEHWVHEALHAGATSYLIKNVELDTLVAAIRATRQGRMTLSPEATWALVQAATGSPAREQANERDNLTEREQEVLTLLVEGLQNQQIAQRLVITPATVKYHVQRLYSKLQVTSRTELVAQAVQRRLKDTTSPWTERSPHAQP